MENLKRPIKKAVFPVAGLGTRLLPATKVMPKEMLTIVDRPLIQLAVEEACEAGIEEFIFVISEGKDILIQHFQEAPLLMETLRARGKYDQISKIDKINFSDSALKFVRQDKPLGLGHAVWCAKDLVGNEPFAVILPDDTVLSDETCLKQMMGGYHKMGGNLIASCEVPIQDTSRYGVFKMIDRKDNTFTVQDLVEKPDPSLAPSNMAIFGRYILQPEIFGFLDEHEKGTGGEIQLTDAMAKLIRHQPFYGYIFEGERLDCGSEIGFVKAQIAFALKRPDLAPDIKSYMSQKLKEV
ncbi:MAG: UTP--glucose-1-phosphate uridylyltransferase [Alphaproteobacteria bacterium]|nr:UTP--glucose-1-phosphate uridylyltransferase [Alphaproteobacteria bacterium]